MTKNKQYTETALLIAKKIAPTFKEGFYQINQIDWKSAGDPVTEYDRKIEQMTRDLLSEYYPDHVVLGEENGLQNNTESDFKWIVDPIDGTVNYTRSIPFVAYSLALSYRNEIIAAVVANPILDEYFYATKGEGAYLNNTKLTVSNNDVFKQCYISYGSYNSKYSVPIHTLINAFQSVRSPGSAALALAYIAAGRMDGLVYFRLAPWDMAAGILLVQEAQGQVSNINNHVFDLEKSSIIAGSSLIHQKISEQFIDFAEFS
ncbi:MAG: inositol monophosphatase family protein [Brevinema sp.]